MLPNEDAEEVARRFRSLEAAMDPLDDLAVECVKRVALMTVRLDRSAEHEAKAISFRMRKAKAEFDEARLAEVEKAYSWIASEPATHARRLRSSPEGIDRLIRAMEEIRDDLNYPDSTRWSFQHCDHFHHMTGRRRADVPVSRPRALSDAILLGNFQHLTPADRPELEKLPRQCWAAAELIKLIDVEIEALKQLRVDFDLDALALDRDEAPARAYFDAAPPAILARKYEATNERGFYRAIREFRDVQAEARIKLEALDRQPLEPDPEPAGSPDCPPSGPPVGEDLTPEVVANQQLGAEMMGQLGSFFPETSGVEDQSVKVDPLPIEADRRDLPEAKITEKRGRKPVLDPPG